MRYFARTSHAFLLAGVTLVTYGIGGLVYWLARRGHFICPSCGLSWKYARSVGASGPARRGRSAFPSRETDSPEGGRRTRASGKPLPAGGGARRLLGLVLLVVGVVILVAALTTGELEALPWSMVFGLAGAGSLFWGGRARRRRRQAVLERTHLHVLRLAGARGGRLTATEVAAELDFGVDGAERILFSMEDGFRVRSDVTEEGVLVWDFPEIRMISDRS